MITCPGDITVTAADGVSAVVNYSFTADDGCTCPVIAMAIPAQREQFFRRHPYRHLRGQRSLPQYQYLHLSGHCAPARVPALRIELTQPSPPQVTLTWDCDAALQSAADLAGPWSSVAGAVSPYVTTAAEPQSFYRLKFSSAGSALQFPGTGSAFTSATVPYVLHSDLWASPLPRG